MPIICSAEFKKFDQDSFHQMDRTVTGLCFDIHNTLGRLHDEAAYQEALLQKCHSCGLIAEREVKIEAKYKEFSKRYYLDLVVENGIIYELKASSNLIEAYDSQLMNYLMLTDTKHGKVLNFRSASVTSRFISTTLSTQSRYNYNILTDYWKNTSVRCPMILHILSDLLDEWGSHLAINLYREALLHQIGVNKEGTRIPIYNSGKLIGAQALTLLDSTTAIHCSGIKDQIHYYEIHLMRLLKSTKLNCIQWINFNGHQINCSSIIK